jgi:hypothetical protein
MPNALIPNEIDRGDARSWGSNPALKMMTQSSLRRQLKYLPMSPGMSYGCSGETTVDEAREDGAAALEQTIAEPHP